MVDITVLVCTYNRCGDLRELLESALAQKTGDVFTYEILVVDNNSKDDTRYLVESLMAKGDNQLRYLFEGRQGKSYALNTGLKAAHGQIYAIADDDLLLPEDYLKNVFEAFCEHPEISFLGGKVLPLWTSEPPTWLTERHWAAIAMTDRGQKEFHTSEDHQLCLLAGAFRLAHVNEVGGYDVELGVSGVKIGGTEDTDIYQRLYRAGRKGLYCPRVWLYHKVEPERLTKRYHRRWHRDHGRSYAVMRAAEVEQGVARLFDVPAHLYKQAAADVFGYVRCVLWGKMDDAFRYELQLRFFAGYFSKRRDDYLASGRHGTVRELILFTRALAFGSWGT